VVARLREMLLASTRIFADGYPDTLPDCRDEVFTMLRFDLCGEGSIQAFPPVRCSGRLRRKLTPKCPSENMLSPWNRLCFDPC
jgi:hypothetical protein